MAEALWNIDVDGQQILLLNIDYAVTLHLHGKEKYETSIRLASPFRFLPAGSDPRRIDPEDAPTVAPVLSLFGARTRTLTIGADSTLVLEFEDGARIECEPDPQYEAWEVNAPRLKLIAMPRGGEPAVFGDRV
jgi:hypothetical protein